ncbi:MAG TPA: hypothetical protein VMU47_07400 [Caldimonas sp.]|nr:hypothetical protein [Caldimonas sp.]
MSTARPAFLVAVAVAFAFTALSARADSLASSASSAGSASVGSVSDSFHASSNSSSNDNRKNAEGDYRVDAIVAVAGRPDRVRLELRPLDRPSEEGFALELPTQALEYVRLAAGSVVNARPRPYGVEFALAPAGEPFYLVLDDDWYRELAAHRVTL